MFTFSRQMTPGGDRSKEMYAAIDTLFEPVREHCRELRNFLREINLPHLMPKSEQVIVELTSFIGAAARDITPAMERLNLSIREIDEAYVAQCVTDLKTNKNKLAITNFNYQQTEEDKTKMQELYNKQIKPEIFSPEEEQYVHCQLEATFKAMLTTITQLQTKLSTTFDAVLKKMTDLRFKFPGK